MDRGLPIFVCGGVHLGASCQRDCHLGYFSLLSSNLKVCLRARALWCGRRRITIAHERKPSAEHKQHQPKGHGFNELRVPRNASHISMSMLMRYHLATAEGDSVRKDQKKIKEA